VVGQLGAPAAIHDLVRVGLVRQQTEWMEDLLHDPAITGAVLVTLPEEMPVTETLELADRLRDEAAVAVAAVVVNRVLPELFSRREEAAFEQLRQPARTKALVDLVGPAVTAVLDGAQLATDMRRGRAAHIERLVAGLDPPAPLLYLPELFTRAKGIRLTRMLAATLEEEL
jgi:anion-transporting  ArsA/GET3 family ATPase